MVSTYPSLDDFSFDTALAVSNSDEVLSLDGDSTQVFEWKSVTKPLVALATLIAIDQGHLDLQDPAGPEGATVRHLLAHTSGLPFEEGPTQSLERRRVYSNVGFETLGEHLEAGVGTDLWSWVRTSVVEPLELNSTALQDSPAHGVRSNILDLLALGLEMLTPTLISADLAKAARTVQFPGLAGVLPGFGSQDRNDWGLGYEIRGEKDPHWTSPGNSAGTFGHFGQSGSFVWVDPAADLVAVFLGEVSFRQDTHAVLWPKLSTEILQAHRS